MTTREIKTIENLLEIDQNAIKDFKSKVITLDELKKIIENNLNILKDFINKYSFPFINTTSEKAYKAAFLIIQHSGDLDLIKITIEIFEKAEKGEIKKRDLAYLIDKYRILKNKLQLFGTQYKILDNKIEFIEIEDRDNLKKRRKDYEMETLEEYIILIKNSLGI